MVEYNPYAYEVHEDPYPFYARLRAEAPVYWAWRNPAERDKVWRDPGRVAAWVGETLRYDPSTQALARTATCDFEIEGRRLREGDKVLLLIGSANRDDSVFPAADRYDLDRDTTASLAFGRGTHFCLGASLARLEARVALEEVRRRLPDFEIDPAGLVRVHSTNVRGFAAMPMEFPAARRLGAASPQASASRGA
jgi:hypothetical protein